MDTIRFLLGAFALAICFNACLSQNFTSYAKTCNDCNSTNADCTLKPGYVMCSCKSGFLGNGLNCTRLVFCDTTQCCPPGYTWDNAQKLCVDINECLDSSLYTCRTQSECINKNGIYICNAAPNPTCPTDVCATDKDCIKDGTILKCVDPCENYQEIDGSYRLYTMNSVGRFPTDRYLHGWYRYKNGLRLREGFVGPLKCGSIEPYSLSSHPTVCGVMKSVALLSNGLSSNSTGPSILVKACAAGYYVYKFAGLMKSEVYCTDYPSTTTTTITTPTTTTTIPSTTTKPITTTRTQTTKPKTTTTKPSITITPITKTATRTTTKPKTATTRPAIATTPTTRITPLTTTRTPKSTAAKSTVLPTTHSPIEENITVIAVQSRSILRVHILTKLVNNTKVRSLEINETTTINIEMRAISSSKIYIKTTKSITPSSILIHVGSDGPQTFSNATGTVITTTENTVPNNDHFNPDTYCSTPAKTNTVTETSAIAGNTCSEVTSSSAISTITTTEEVIVLRHDGFAKSCGFH